MEDEMNGAYDMCGRGVECVEGCVGETLYDLGVNGSMILKWTWTGFIWLQWCTGGGLGASNPSLKFRRPSKIVPNSIQL